MYIYIHVYIYIRVYYIIKNSTFSAKHLLLDLTLNITLINVRRFHWELLILS